MMNSPGGTCDKILVICLSCILSSVIVSANIEGNGDGSYCINKISKRGVPANCSSDSVCEEILGIAINAEEKNLRCGEQGECVTKLQPKNEQCKEACDSSPCGKLCLQEHETKTAKYCIETRDHPNAMPVNNNSSVMPPNKYFCTCIISEGFHHHYHHHRVVSRYLRYKFFD